MSSKHLPEYRQADKQGLLSAINDFQSAYVTLQDLIDIVNQCMGQSEEKPYDLVVYIKLSSAYSALGYPDLSVGAAYKALLLSDAVQDESDEYHEQAVDAIVYRGSCIGEIDETATEETAIVAVKSIIPLIYERLIDGLLACGCFRSAYHYSSLALQIHPDLESVQDLKRKIFLKITQHFKLEIDAPTLSDLPHTSDWPDQGFARRERYPWNRHEPHRLSELGEINAMMSKVAPKLEIRAVDLPILSEDIAGTLDGGKVTKQLGLFAKEDFAPGDCVLNETSLLTANNKLLDALCDACSADLPSIRNPGFASTVSCSDCEVVFCSQDCHDDAQITYHPAICDKDVEAIARDVPATEAANSLYSLLLLRALAMAHTQDCHPLDLTETKYIWADFHNLPVPDLWQPPTHSRSPFGGLPQTLPFSFEHNIRLPFHMLEKMDIDIFANPQYDVWVFNTLYAKFRGTASARLSGLGGRAIRGPEVSAVHPMWSMANHSCDPNVSWEWGGSIQFSVREERSEWSREGDVRGRTKPGIRKGEEVLNHYCDVELGVKDRREWASGALGGDCRCSRCLWEAGESC